MNRVLLIIIFCFAGNYLNAQETLVSLWTFVTGGRILGDPVISDDDQVFAISEDKKLYCLDREGKVIFVWSNGERLQGSLTLTSGGRLTLVTLSNQVICLNTVPKTGPVVLWTYRLDSELSCPPAIDFYGNQVFGTQKGGLFVLNSSGQLIWSQAYESPVLSLLTQGGISILGLFAKTLRVLDGAGNTLFEVPNRGSFTQVVLNSKGQIVLWGKKGFETLSGQGEVVGGYQTTGLIVNQLLLDFQEDLVLFHNEGILQVGPQGQVRKQWLGTNNLNGLVTESGIIGLDLNRLHYPSKKISFKIPPQNRRLTLSAKGLLVIAGEDWNIYGYQCASPWSGPWSQSGGGPFRQFQFTPAVNENSLNRLYEKNWDYVYLMKRASSRDPVTQEEVLNEIEKKSNLGTLKSDWPFADLVLMRIALDGILFVDSPSTVGKNNFPINRARAYYLLSSLTSPRVRYLLIQALKKEFDAYALRNAAAALGKVGYDYDGESAKALKTAQDRFPSDEALARVMISAVKSIIKFNRRISDISLGDVLTKVFQGNFSLNTKLEAQKAFQYLISGVY